MLSTTLLASVLPLLLVGRQVAAHCELPSPVVGDVRAHVPDFLLFAVYLPLLQAVSTLAVAVLKEQFKNSLLVPVRPVLDISSPSVGCILTLLSPCLISDPRIKVRCSAQIQPPRHRRPLSCQRQLARASHRAQDGTRPFARRIGRAAVLHHPRDRGGGEQTRRSFREWASAWLIKSTRLHATDRSGSDRSAVPTPHRTRPTTSTRS